MTNSFDLETNMNRSSIAELSESILECSVLQFIMSFHASWLNQLYSVKLKLTTIC